MKNRLTLLLVILLSFCSLIQAETPKDVTREVRKLRAEAAYQEMKGNYEQSLQLYQQSLELLPDEKVEQKVIQIKEKLGITEPEPEAVPEAVDVPETAPVPEVPVVTEVEKPANAATGAEPDAANAEPVVADETHAETVVDEPMETVSEPETPAVEVTETVEEIVQDTTEEQTVEVDVEVVEETPAKVASDIAGVANFIPVEANQERSERLIGTAFRSKINRLGSSDDLGTLIWDQEEKVDDQEIHHVFVNGTELELPVTLTYFGFPVVTNSHEFVVNVDVDVGEDAPDEALLINGSILGNYYEVKFPVLSADHSTWASALIDREMDESTQVYNYTSTLLVNGKTMIEVPGEIEKIKLSPDGAKVAFSASVRGEEGSPNCDRVYIGTQPVGPEVDTCYDLKWDPNGENLFWCADTMRDNDGNKSRILVKNADIISEHALDTDSLYFAKNVDLWAFKENAENGYNLVTSEGKTETWKSLEDVSFSPNGKLGFVGTNDEGTRIYIDGEAVGPAIVQWYGVRDLVWSSDSKHWAADAMIAENQKVILLDGKEVATGISAGGHVFSPDNKRLASWIRNENKEYAIVIDGEVGPWMKDWETSSDIIFSPDSQHVFYWRYSADKKHLVLTRDHEAVSGEDKDVAPQLYFDEDGAVWFVEIAGMEPGEFFLKRLK